MGISRLTVMAIEANEIVVIDTLERSEAWMMKDGQPHALLLSSPLNKRSEMERFIEEVKQGHRGLEIR